MVKGSSIATVSPTRAIRRHNLIVSVLGFVIVMGLLGYWQVFARAPAVTYGDTGQVRFSQRSAAPGAEISLCFDSVTWHRLCPAELVTSLLPGRGIVATRFDLPAYRISTPQKVGAVEPKCRPFRVPAVLPAGTWTLQGYARAECPPFGSWVPVTTELPSATLEIVAK